MSNSMIPPILASRTTALSSETAPVSTDPTPTRLSWTLFDVIVVGLSAVALVFAGVGILVSLLN